MTQPARKALAGNVAAAIGSEKAVGAILDHLTAGLCSALRGNLVGIYVYGSLIAGDFDAAISDIDLVVVLRKPLDEARFAALQQLHQDVVRDRREWQDRLELAYISRRSLRRFRSETSTIGIISPGEPFHLVQAGSDWLISWHALREDGVALLGPPIESLVDPISARDYLRAVREHIEGYRDMDTAAANAAMLSYTTLTVARGLFTLRHGEPTSKIKAAAWAQDAFPHWSPLIQLALAWRVDASQAPHSLDAAARCVASFVDEMLANMPELEDSSRTERVMQQS
ncbi:MAG: DUF4111 domain-containing protein [Chloroflexi bacterium]|nr:DUF4111 domain-containing protein [Chloroflexota bacterium]MCY4248716.1 DUF4111 domain-containing protein [Chloroflexota bacterium]